MNLVLVTADEVGTGGRVTLRGRRAEHLLRVLGVEIGARVRIGIVHGALGVGEVVACGAGAVVFALTLTKEPAPSPTVSLALALPRPKALPRVVAAAAAMGVARIEILNAWRVDKSYLDSPRLAPKALAEAAWLGCEQGCQTWLPEIVVHRRFMDWIAELVARPACRRLVAHPHGARLLEDCELAANQPVLLALGPDGGWIEPELETLKGVGFAVANLGPWVLRSEVAAPVALAELALLRRLAARSPAAGAHDPARD